jgi:hypothetical protein
MPCFLHLQSVNNKQKCTGGLLIAIIMGVLVDNTITKANNHFGPKPNRPMVYTRFFAQNNLPSTLEKFVGFTAEHPVHHYFISFAVLQDVENYLRQLKMNKRKRKQTFLIWNNVYLS